MIKKVKMILKMMIKKVKMMLKMMIKKKQQKSLIPRGEITVFTQNSWKQNKEYAQSWRERCQPGGVRGWRLAQGDR